MTLINEEGGESSKVIGGRRNSLSKRKFCIVSTKGQGLKDALIWGGKGKKKVIISLVRKAYIT